MSGWIWAFRIVFIAISGYLCFLAVSAFPELLTRGGTSNFVYLTMAGMLTSILLMFRIEQPLFRRFSGAGEFFSNLSPRKVIAGTVGSILGLLLSVLINTLLSGVPFYHWSFSILLTIILVSFFIAFATKNADVFGTILATGNYSAPQARFKNAKIMDTNIIIDGRVVELSRSGFLEGTLVVPQFVLKELQFIADQSDATRRARGRRGLEVLEALYDNAELKVIEWDAPEIKTVDDKLVKLAKDYNAKLLTNDFNLAKVAKVQNVEVLSINQLALAVKPKFNAGDVIQVQITKDGQQGKQGVAYLEDGTMVVVEDALGFKGQPPINVMVVSNIQTNVGRMIFARLDEK